MKVFSIFLFSWVLSAQFSWAGETYIQALPEKPNYRDGLVYQEIYRSCSMQNGIVGKYKQTWNSFFNNAWSTAQIGFFDLQKASDLYQNRFLSNDLVHKMADRGFYWALEDCFPKNPTGQTLFLFHLIQEDLVANGVGITLAGVFLVAPIKFIGWLRAQLAVVGGGAETLLTTLLQRSYDGALTFSFLGFLQEPLIRAYKTIRFKMDPVGFLSEAMEPMEDESKAGILQDGREFLAEIEAELQDNPTEERAAFLIKRQSEIKQGLADLGFAI